MNVKCAKKTATKLNTFDTLLPVHKMLKPFALTAVYRENGSLKLRWYGYKYLAIGLSTLAATLAFIFKVVNYLYINEVYIFHFTDNIQITYLLACLHYVIDVTYVHRYGRELFLKYMQLFDQFDDLLGNPYFCVMKKRVRKLALYLLSTAIIISFMDSVSWYLNYGWRIPVLYSIDYVYFLLNLLMVLEACSHVIQAEYRLKILGDYLQYYYSSATKLDGMFQDVINERNWLYHTSNESRNNFLDSVLYSPQNYEEIIKEFNRCYMLLLEQNNYVNCTFGIRIIINFFNLLLAMVNEINLTIRILFGLFTHTEFWIVSVLTTSGRAIFSLAIITCLLHRCEQTYSQSERIVSIIDHTLTDKKIAEEARVTLADFRRLVLTRPIMYHANNFFKLRYSLLVSMVSAIITYTIILLQNLP